MRCIVIALLVGITFSQATLAQGDAGREVYQRNFVTTMLKKAEQGDAQAQSFLGIMYEKGIGVVKDEAEALKWYRKAAEQGNAQAASILGIMYADGLGVPRNEEEALVWFRKQIQTELREFSKRPIQFRGGYQGAIKAAEGGDPLAQTIVGKMYLTGSGVTQDDVEAVHWLTEGTKGFAAAGAKEALGLLYEEGRGGLPKDKAEARRLYRKAAEQTAANLESSVRMVYQFGPI